MENNRRKFIRSLAVGTGVLATGIPSFAGITATTDEETERSLHDAIMIVRRAKKNDAVVAGKIKKYSKSEI